MTKWLMSHPHGCVSWNHIVPESICIMMCHTLTGVWVEISQKERQWPHNGHTLTGVWVEIMIFKASKYGKLSHPHGCVSWNSFWLSPQRSRSQVTPSRVCELKSSRFMAFPLNKISVTPSRVCELKSPANLRRGGRGLSHPHGCVSWNDSWQWNISKPITSHPHGCVSWNF